MKRLRLSRFLVLAALLAPHAAAHAGTPFVRGDANGDEALDVSDPVKILLWLFDETSASEPLDAFDVNDDGVIQITDGIYALNYLFAFGPEPAPPFPAAGFDPTPGDPYTGGDFAPTLAPDLVPKELFFDAEGFLHVTFANEGRAAVPEGAGAVSVFARDRIVRIYELAALPDQSFRVPGGSTTLETDVRLAGANVYVGVHVDSRDEIAEANEFQNTLTRTLQLPEEPGAAAPAREKGAAGGTIPDAYLTLLADPRIETQLVWHSTAGQRSYSAWSQEEKQDLAAAITAIENGGTASLAGPPALLPGNSIGAADAWTIYLAHVAQSLWVEVHGAVAWSFLEYPDEWLAYLFDGRKLVQYSSGNNTYRFSTGLLGSVTAWNPRLCYDFLTGFDMVRDTQLETIHSLTDWMRGHLIHTLGSDGFTELFGYAGLPPVDKVLFPLEGRRHKTAGCWGTTGLYAAVLRSVNIPVASARLTLGRATHSRPEFLTVDRSMPHGDDPYTTILTPSGAVIASSRLLYSLAEMEQQFLAPELDCNEGTCNTVGDQALYNSGRDHVQAAFEQLADYLLYQFSRYGAAYLDDSLRGPRIGGGVVEYARPYFSPDERAQMITAVEERVRAIGEGDLEEGKRIVQERYHRFGSNK